MKKTYVWGVLGGLVLILIVGAVVWNAISSQESSSSSSSSESQNSSLIENARVERTDEGLFELPLKTLDGQDTSLEDWKGTPLVVNIWASWCPFCTDELPAFARLQNTYENQLTVVAVNREESTQKIRKYLSGTEDISEDDLTFLRDPKDKLGRTVNRFSMPETLFISPDGTTVFHQRGPLEFEQMKTLVEAMDSVNSSN